MKRANITRVHKKNDPLDKKNYIFNQLSEHMQKFLNKILCGFCKAHSTQHALFRLFLAWQNSSRNSPRQSAITEGFAEANSV